MGFEEIKQHWSEMDPKHKALLVAVTLTGVVLVGMRAMQNSSAPAASAAPASTAPAPAPGDPAFHQSVLPQTNRNMGLEDMKTQNESTNQTVQALEAKIARLEQRPNGAAGGSGIGSQDLPPPVTNQSPAGQTASRAAGTGADNESIVPPPPDFNAPSGQGAQTRRPKAPAPQGEVDFPPPGSAGGNRSAMPAAPGDPAEAAPPRMKTWEPEASTGARASEDDTAGIVIPVNSALESVMLSGINARPSGSVAGAVGTAVSANNVGAPFVTRLKGDAILPNGWKLSELGDCFLGGSGVAVLSTERAYVIADNLSCIAPNGEVYEAAVKAYGLDVDGTLGVAGKVVSKQGALLLQAALTGMASGLGAALAPTTISAYNTSATNGSTAGVQYPNLGTVGYTAVGQGINQAAGQLSKFYLEYAKETFPVVEVVSGTRVTWVLKESIELHRRNQKVAVK